MTWLRKVLRSEPILVLGHAFSAALVILSALAAHGTLLSGMTATPDTQTTTPLVVGGLGLLFTWLARARVFSPATVERLTAEFETATGLSGRQLDSIVQELMFKGSTPVQVKLDGRGLETVISSALPEPDPSVVDQATGVIITPPSDTPVPPIEPPDPPPAQPSAA